ncbi:hypothetical protein C2869_04055 [Saccharobesus litoralis]|uniref:Malectin domain-containing protein n=1 Tax=Saccharobesus litoralis TaxID=2172099 RepID=A0A2S0VNK5_9ALTE|nr:thrombospondin type 3 repeat-containing protein [Saccharobesus litoralis]AWB65660.1 hypothetical protein C2869_04055 [Saccharobesus litoralis]
MTIKSNNKQTRISPQIPLVKTILLGSMLILTACGGGGSNDATSEKDDPKVIVDQDKDGIADDKDLCQTTPAQLASDVDTNGCHADEKNDSDGDQLVDAVDQCPNTPTAYKDKVDATGCHTDTTPTVDADGDGVADAMDHCPVTPQANKDNVDAQGCHSAEVADKDRDGVADTIDKCTNTHKDAVNIDADGCDDGEYYITLSAINSGRLEFIADDGQFFSRDHSYYIGRNRDREGATYIEKENGVDVTKYRDVLNTNDDYMYRHHKYGPKFEYRLPVANGSYFAKLHLVETLWNSEVGSRVFDVAAETENNKVLTAIDVHQATAGRNIAYQAITNEISVDDGQLNLYFIASTGDAMLSGLEIVKKVHQDHDEDNDGVKNINDMCIFTPSDYIAHINDNGCAPDELDDDNDGVINAMDNCANTENIANFPTTNRLVDANGCSLDQLDNDNDGKADHIDQCDNTPAGEANVVNAKGCSASELSLLTQAFKEKDGLLVVEMESTNYPAGWHLKTGDFATGNQYLEWNGGNFFATPHTNPTTAGYIDVDIKITNPGTYRFIWRSVIGHGTNFTEHNDGWIRIEANNFFGYKQKDNSTVCPREQLASNACVETIPVHGGSGQGFIKLYRGGGPADYWTWISNVSDNNAHSLYATFDNPGEYKLTIAGRSKYYGIDRFVLFRDSAFAANNNAGPTRTFWNANLVSHPESSRE